MIIDDNALIVDDKRIHFFSDRDPKNINWATHDVDIVVECSGRFTDRSAAMQHLTSPDRSGGARRVLISAPGKDADATVVFGVNHHVIKAEDVVVSNGSCTTNCLAPVAKTLHDQLEIVRGYMTTIHAYTGDQRTVDGSHADLYRARAAALSAIPTSTGAAKALGLVVPELKGRLDGSAIRIPTPNVSLVDLSFDAGRATSASEINAMIKHAADTHLKGVLAYNDEALVSVDFNHHPASSIFDAIGTQVVDGTFVRVLAWYDNEWGFSNRLVDVTSYMAGL